MAYRMEERPQGPRLLGKLVDLLIPSDKASIVADRRLTALTSARGQLDQVLHEKIFGEGNGQAIIQTRETAHASGRVVALAIPVGERDSVLAPFQTPDGHLQQGSAAWSYSKEGVPTLNVVVTESSAGSEPDFSYNLELTYPGRTKAPLIKARYKDEAHNLSGPHEIKFPPDSKIPHEDVRRATVRFGQIVENLVTPQAERPALIHRLEERKRASDTQVKPRETVQGPMITEYFARQRLEDLRDVLDAQSDEQPGASTFFRYAVSTLDMVAARSPFPSLWIPSRKLPEKLRAVYPTTSLVAVRAIRSGDTSILEVIDGKHSVGYDNRGERFTRFSKDLVSKGGGESRTYGESDAIPAVGELLNSILSEALDPSLEVGLGRAIAEYKPPTKTTKDDLKPALDFLGTLSNLASQIAANGYKTFEVRDASSIDTLLVTERQGELHINHLRSDEKGWKTGREVVLRAGGGKSVPSGRIKLQERGKAEDMVEFEGHESAGDVVAVTRLAHETAKVLLRVLTTPGSQISAADIQARELLQKFDRAPDATETRWTGSAKLHGTVWELAEILEGASGGVRFGRALDIFVSQEGRQRLVDLLAHPDIAFRVDEDEVSEVERDRPEERDPLVSRVAETFPELHSDELDAVRALAAQRLAEQEAE